MPVSERQRADGTSAFLAQIDILVKGELAQQNRTFDKKGLADIWIAKRSKEIRILIDQGKAGQLKAKRRTLADAIKTYLNSHQRDMGPTKRQVLNTILNDYEISQRAWGDITSQDIVALAQELVVLPPLKSSTYGYSLSHVLED